MKESNNTQTHSKSLLELQYLIGLLVSECDAQVELFHLSIKDVKRHLSTELIDTISILLLFPILVLRLLRPNHFLIFHSCVHFRHSLPPLMEPPESNWGTFFKNPRKDLTFILGSKNKLGYSENVGSITKLNDGANNMEITDEELIKFFFGDLEKSNQDRIERQLLLQENTERRDYLKELATLAFENDLGSYKDYCNYVKVTFPPKDETMKRIRQFYDKS